MALLWLKPYRLMSKNARLVLGIVCLLAWLAPVESWAQGSLWDDLKVAAKQAVQDKIRVIPTTVTTPSSSQQSTQAPITTSENAPSDLLRRIDKALARSRKPSDYLYETTSVSGQIVGTWTEMTDGILGTKDLRAIYDNFYQSSVAYAGMTEVNLHRARTAALNNSPDMGSHFLDTALRYEQQFILSNKAAIQAYDGNIDASAELAKGLYEGSKAAAIYGSSFVMGPVGSRVVDTVFDVTDFAVEASDNGLSSATRKLVADKLTEMIFSHAQVNGKTLEDTINQGVTKTLGNPEVYKVVRGVISKPEFAKAFMSFMAKTGAYTVGEITEDQVNKIITVVMEGGANKMPPLTVYASDNGKSGLPETKAGTATNLAKTGSDTNAAHVVDNTTSGLSGDEVANALGPTKENARAAAIAKMVRQGAIRSPLTADELTAILKGTTGGNRSYAIAQLSALINPHLTAPEAATVLGSVNELRENNRAAAIRSLVRTSVPGSWGAEASEPLNGSTGGNRSYAIAQLASRLRANLTGMEVATILGQPEELRENNRAAAIRSLVVAGRLRLPFSGDELNLVLTGTTGRNRSYAIGLLTKRR